ncbi:MMPL family transporter, partial [Actinacidiphila guanduensis]
MEALGRLIARNHRRVLVVALLGFLALSVYGITAFGKLSSGGQVDPKAPSTQAEQLVDDHFGGTQGLVVLVTAKAGTVDSPAVQAVGAKIAATLHGQPWVDNVTSYFTTHAPGLRSTDQRSALVLAHVQDEDGHKSGVDTLLKDLKADGGAAATVRSGGQTGADSALTTQIGKDLGIVSIVAVPITIVLLYFVFGGLLASLLPLGVAAIAIMGTFAELRLLAGFVSVSTYAIDLNIALGLGLAVDYGLLIVNRYREEVAHGHATEDALARTATSAGRTVLFSAVTVALALTALLVFPVYFLKSFAYAGIAVVFFAAVGALLVLPALLAAMGARVARRRRSFRRPRPARAADPGAPAVVGSRGWTRVTTAVTHRPLAFAAPILLALVVIGLPLLNVHFSTPDDRALPTSAAAHQVGDALRDRFAGNGNSALTAVTAKPAGSPAAPTPAQTREWAQYTARLSRLPGAEQVQGPGGTYRNGRPVHETGPALSWYHDGYVTWTVDNTLDATSGQAADLVHDIRDTPTPAHTSVLVGGRAADLVDQKHSIGSGLPWAAAIMVIASFVMLFLFTGSIWIPVKALVLNALTLFTITGAMIWVFQGGHLSGLLNFTPTATSTTIPPLLVVIAFALMMDYEVFLISRIKELHERGLANREAIVQGMARAGTIVTTAAALLSVTFFAFGLSRISFLQFFGIGTGLAVLLDAFVVRGILVPAAMKLAGERIWWAPAPLRRLYDRFGLREEDD